MALHQGLPIFILFLSYKAMYINFTSFLCNSDVNIQLTEDDYRSNEANMNIGIAVSKDARIATDMSLSVTPVVVSEARSLNLFPMNVDQPDNLQGRSPVDAGERTISMCLNV